MRNPTIKDVAREAGVSVATVSRVLNGIEGCTEDTRKNVMEAIHTIGYKRNALARNLKTNQSRTIAIVIPEITQLFYAAIMREIEVRAAMAGYSVIVCNTGPSGKYLEQYLDSIQEQQIAGVVYLSMPMTPQIENSLAKCDKPSVMLCTMSYRLNIPYVKLDNFRGGYSAAQHLLEMGHKRIAIISGYLRDEIAGKPRYEGYLSALRDAGVESDQELAGFCDFSFSGGREAFRTVLNRNRDFTAVFACGDEIAAGVLVEARLAGLRVPEDLSVVGFDNTQFASISCPPLTTLAIPYDKIAENAIRILTDQIECVVVDGNCVLNGEMVLRDSVQRLSGNA